MSDLCVQNVCCIIVYVWWVLSTKCSSFVQYKMFECSVQNVHGLIVSTKCLYKCPPLYLRSSGGEEEAPGDSYLTLSWQKQKFNLLQISLRSTHFVTVVNTTNENENLTYCGCGTRSKDALQIECWGLSINEVILVCEADLESLILSVRKLHV